MPESAACQIRLLPLFVNRDAWRARSALNFSTSHNNDERDVPLARVRGMECGGLRWPRTCAERVYSGLKPQAAGRLGSFLAVQAFGVRQRGLPDGLVYRLSDFPLFSCCLGGAGVTSQRPNMPLAAAGVS